MGLKIYDRNGGLRIEVQPSDSSSQTAELQGDDVLSMSFTHHGYVGLEVDDYVDFEGVRYRMTERYRPKQKSAMEWEYSIKLYGPESLLRDVLVIKNFEGEHEAEFTLTAPPGEHVALVVSALNGDNGSEWKRGTVTGSENITIDYFGKYCDEALREIAEKAGTEYWTDGTTVNVCRCEHGEPLTLGLADGLTRIEPATAGNVKFYTRLFPMGSTRNIDAESYGHRRLQLPDGAKYVEINADRYRRKDHYEEAAFADIYPRYTGTVSSVRSETRKGADGEDFTVYYIKDDALPFDPDDYLMAGKVMRISFQEGSDLGGLGDEDNGTYYFETNWHADTGEFELITIWPYKDSATQLPGGVLVPKAGDKYIPWNMRMPQEYYTLAEAEFAAAVQKYNADHDVDLTVFKAQTDHVWVEDNAAELFVGRRVRLVSDRYFPETGYRDSRITKISRKINLPTQMEVEIGDALGRSSKTKITDDIRDARDYARSIGNSVSLPDIIRTGDTTRPTDNNLMSALRIIKDFLCKYKDDRTAHKLASDKAFEVGEFLAGISGGFFGIDQNGESYLEVARLYARVRAVFEELTVIKTGVLAGKQYITPGGGIVCTKVEEVTNASGTLTGWRCYFLSEQDGEKTECKFVANDQAISALFNATTGTANKVSNHRYWRLVTAVDNDAYTDDSGNHYGYIELSTTDCEAGSDTPQAGDEICQLGNRTDATRQTAIVFSTVDADSPSIKMFGGIGSGTSNAEHYSLNGKAIISFGRDATTGKVYFRLGATGATQYLEYNQDGGLTLNGKLSIGSTIGDKPLDKYFTDLIPEIPEEYDDTEIKAKIDKYKYLAEALPQDTDVIGGVVLSTLVSLGYKDSDGTRHTLAGMNGSYVPELAGRTIGSWWGGEMEDIFNADGTKKATLTGKEATSLVRMDGSFYFANGNIGGRTDGSGWLAGDNITWDASGAITFGNGIKIDLGGGKNTTLGGIQDTLGSVLTIVNGLSNELYPVDSTGARVDWGSPNTWAIKSVKGFFSDSFISARGVNPDGGGSGGGGVYYLHELLDAAISNPASGQALVYNGTKWVNQAIQTGLDEAALASYLTTHNYATQQWVESKGYLTAHQSLANYVTLNTPQNITANKVFYGEERFVANGLTYTDPWSGIVCAIKVTGKVGITDSIKAASFIKSNGTASQFLKADGSVDGNTYLTTVNAAATYVSKAGDTMTGLLSVTRAGNFVGDFDEGIRVHSCGQHSWAAVVLCGTDNTGDSGTSANTWGIFAHDGAFGIGRNGNGITAGTARLWCDTSNVWRINGTNVLWHAGNDGAGSGLDADLLDGLHIADIRGLGYAMQDTWIDASSLDVDTWYPVTLSLGSMNNVRIEVLVSLNSGTKPSWSLHNGGFSVRVIWEVNGSGWGASPINRTIYAADCGFTATSPVRGIGQMNHSSNEYVFVRGGGKYRFRTSHGAFPILRTSTYKPSTTDDQSVSPTTTAPAEIVRDNARTSDNVASATKLQTARTIWGQSFNGTANVSGSLTGVSSIGFNGNYEFGIHNGRYVFGTTGQVGAAGANVGSLLVSNMWADATKVPTNGIYVKGDLRIGDITLSYDAANGGLHVSGGGLYADTYLSARGANTSGSGSSGGGLIQQVYGSSSLGGAFSDTTLTDTFNAYTINKIRTDLINADSALSGRITSLEGGAAVNVTTTGSGNAITAISKSGTTITATKGSTFLTAHQSLANYVTLNTTQTITGAKSFNGTLTINTQTILTGAAISMGSSIGNATYDKYHRIDFGFHSYDRINIYEKAVNFFTNGGTTAHTVITNTGLTAPKFIKSDGTASQFLMGDGSVVTKKTLSTVDNSGWTTFATDDKLVPTMAFIAYWNGRHNASNSNLQYCDRGRFGTIVTHSHSEYVTALGTSGDYLTWTKNGAANNITVPYATTAAQLTGSAEHTGTALADFDRTHTYTCQATNDLGDGISYSAILTVSGGSEHRLFQLIGGKGNTSFLRWRTTDANGTALGAVRRLLDDANYSSVLDSRYYTESEADARFVNVTGDTMTGLLTAKVAGSHTGIKLGNTYLTAINGDTILQNNNAIRFGTDAWDYNQWAGLKYSHTDKTVYLGLADGSIFTANAAQSGGKILTPGISNIYVGNNTTNKIWHAGNDGSGSGLDADYLDGYHESAFLRQGVGRLSTTAAFDIRRTCTNELYNYNPYSFDEKYGTIVTFSSGGVNFAGQFYLPRLSGSHISYRGKNDTNNTWAAWGKLAFLTDNVASATKLQTARSLWGQSFNGTENVDGALTVHHTGACGVYISGGGESSYSCQASGGLRWVSGGYPDRYFIWDSSNNERLSILNNGNVGIGTTSPSYKLDVSGVIHSTTGIWSNGYVSARGQNTASDARFKTILQTKLLDPRSIAAAPSVLFQWKDTGCEDVGSIAQYWQRIDRHLVSHRPDGYLGLDYGKAALLSVISVAKQTLNHEERIKALERENALLKKQIKSLT